MNFAMFKAKIKAAQTKQDILEIYSILANSTVNESVVDRVINACIEKEKQLRQ